MVARTTSRLSFFVAAADGCSLEGTIDSIPHPRLFRKVKGTSERCHMVLD